MSRGTKNRFKLFRNAFLGVVVSFCLFFSPRHALANGTETTFGPNCSTTPATNLNQMQISQFVNYTGVGYGYVAYTAPWLTWNVITGSAVINVTGIPAGATVLYAYLEMVYFAQSGLGGDLTPLVMDINGNPTPTGNAVGLANMGVQWYNTAYNTTSLSSGGFVLYDNRFNLSGTGLVTGNGTYTITQPVAEQNQWPSSTASLIIVYQNPAVTTTDSIQIADGLFGWQTGDGAAPYLWIGDGPEPVNFSFCGNTCANPTDNFTRIGGEELINDAITAPEGYDTFDVPGTNSPTVILTEPGGYQLGPVGDADGGGPSYANLMTYNGLPNSVVGSGTSSLEYWMSNALSDTSDDNKTTLWLNAMVNEVICSQTTPTPTPTNTNTPTRTNTPTPTNTNTPTKTNTPTPTNTITPTPTPTNTPTPPVTPTYTNTPTNTDTPTPTNTITDTPTPTRTPTNTDTPTNTNTITDTPTPTNTPTNTDTPTNTNTITDTPTPTNTPTNTDTPTNTNTPPPTPTPTNTPTNTDTPTNTNTPIPTATPTNTFTVTPTNTNTNTPVPTNTPTVTNTPTNTDTPTYTNTPIPTATPTNTFTVTSTNTNTNSPTNTFTPTDTHTPTNTFTQTATSTFTNSPTNTFTLTPTPTSGVSMGKQVSENQAHSGDILDYSIAVTVTGNSVSGLVVTDILPPNVTFTAFNPSNPVPGTFNAATSILQWVMPSPLAVGIYTLSYQTTVNNFVPANTVVLNKAQVTGPTIAPIISTAPVTVIGQFTVKVNVYNSAGEIVKTILVQEFSQPVNSITLSTSNMITTLNGPGSIIDIYYDGYLIGTWNGTNNLGQPVSNGSYSIQLDNLAQNGVVTSVAQTAMVNRSLANITANVYNESGEVVRTLYNVVDDPVSSMMSNVTLSSNVIRPSLAAPTSITSTLVTIFIETSATPVTLTWDGTNNSGSLVTPGVYTIAIHWNNGSGQTSDISREIVVMSNSSPVGIAVARPNVLNTANGMTTTFDATGVQGVNSIKARIYTIAGQWIQTVTSSGLPQAQWNASGMASGIYIADVEMDNAAGGVMSRQKLKVLVIH